MRMITRYGMILVAAGGLVLGLAPVAGASTREPASPPVTRTVTFPTSFNVYNPCNGSLVSTTGHGGATTITDGQHTAAAVFDAESGEGYTFVVGGAATFASLSSSYTVPSEGIWINLRHPAESFHASIEVVMPVTSSNAPITIESVSVSASCGL
jgi:hypothetical protein